MSCVKCEQRKDYSKSSVTQSAKCLITLMGISVGAGVFYMFLDAEN